MNEFDWNLIRSFVAVAEAGSLSGAARRLAASQPTLGRHVAELEAAIGIVLFRRGRKGYELTEDGAAFLERAIVMRDSADALTRLAIGREERIEGTVRITASEVVATYVLPSILARFGEAEPGIEVEVVASNEVGNLLRRDADIAIRMVQPAQDDIVARKIADLPLTACAATSYLDRRGRPQTRDDLVGHDLVGYDRGEEIIQGFAQFGVIVDRHAFRFRTDSQVAFWEAIRAGNGIGFAQRSLAMRALEVEIVLPELPLPALPMWLAMHHDVRHSPRIRRVADFLYGELKAYSAG
ncbi:MAG: LysR family transcriptional regulator [Rhizobiaceae bacterium]|nr:LysR family transcriptional regulator [Rhizobiaceae bacterium]